MAVTPSERDKCSTPEEADTPARPAMDQAGAQTGGIHNAPAALHFGGLMWRALSLLFDSGSLTQRSVRATEAAVRRSTRHSLQTIALHNGSTLRQASNGHVLARFRSSESRISPTARPRGFVIISPHENEAHVTMHGRPSRYRQSCGVCVSIALHSSCP